MEDIKEFFLEMESIKSDLSKILNEDMSSEIKQAGIEYNLLMSRVSNLSLIMFNVLSYHFPQGKTAFSSLLEKEDFDAANVLQFFEGEN
jgi:hypothetical protein